jgi:hypothetical protein
MGTTQACTSDPIDLLRTYAICAWRAREAGVGRGVLVGEMRRAYRESEDKAYMYMVQALPWDGKHGTIHASIAAGAHPRHRCGPACATGRRAA